MASRKTLLEIHEDVPADHYDKGFKNNVFQRYWHKKRISELKKIVPTNLGVCLDIGCHAGFLTSQVLKNSKYKALFGIDVSKEAIKLAQKKFKKGKFKVADAHKLPFKNETFDTVLCLEVLEHVENPKKVVSEMKRVLKKNGQMIVLVPTESILFRCIWYLWNLANPVWKHAHIQSFKSDSLSTLINKNGLKIDEIKKFNLNMLELIVAAKK